GPHQGRLVHRRRHRTMLQSQGPTVVQRAFSPHPSCRSDDAVVDWARGTMRVDVQALRQGRAVRMALACVGAVLALPAFEIGYRLQAQRPVLSLEDWRAGRLEDLKFGDRVRFDPELGWALRDEYESQGYNTLEWGVRRNFCEKDIRTGGVLAVGDAFTDGGTEVADGETWPAHLERIADVPVLNGGVAGYAIDQIVLRAEQLLTEVQPRTLIVGVHEASIVRASFSVYGTPKPYYTVDSGRLVHHAPVRKPASPAATPDWRTAVRGILGYSAVLDVVLGNLAPEYWQGRIDPPVFQTVDNDPAAVACALLQRLKGRADTAGVRMLLLLQHDRKELAEGTEPGAATSAVAACAAAAGLEVIDQLTSLRAAVAAKPDVLNDLYLSSGFGQMTRTGNRATAELLSGAISRTAALNK
ncbi:MAG TPA: hypothetical protein VFY92_13250, partial [Hyphomicrobiaceae bacterium]|nr:hypothetical protein [Hyphomicrobiaceae bacterium]